MSERDSWSIHKKKKGGRTIRIIVESIYGCSGSGRDQSEFKRKLCLCCKIFSSFTSSLYLLLYSPFGDYQYIKFPSFLYLSVRYYQLLLLSLWLFVAEPSHYKLFIALPPNTYNNLRFILNLPLR